MDTYDLKWREVEDLPIDEEQCRKVLLLTEGRLSGSTTMHIITDYWNVFFDDIDLDLKIFNKKEKLSDNCIAYGKFGEVKYLLKKSKVGCMQMN